MPSSATQLHLPRPCPESWAAMTPTALGRHCAACQKVVVDFTQKTDAELLAYLAQAGRQSCGRFRADQLGRPLVPAATPSRWRSWLASALALGGVLGGGRAAAQAGGNYAGAAPAPTAVQPGAPAMLSLPVAPQPPAAAQPAGSAGAPRVVRGIVLDASNNDPLPGATVALQGTARGTSTAADGRFELPLADADTAGTLAISSVGYSTQRLPIAALGPEPLTLKLDADVQGMGEVIVIGGYAARKPWPWHPRRLYQWSKYQLLRPFQQ